MADYDNTNRGVLFKNDKEGNEARPDYTGTANVGGKELRISAWIKEGKTGKFMSLSFQDKDTQKPLQKKSQTGGLSEMSDDIPF